MSNRSYFGRLTKFVLFMVCLKFEDDGNHCDKMIQSQRFAKNKLQVYRCLTSPTKIPFGVIFLSKKKRVKFPLFLLLPARCYLAVF